MRLTHAHVNFWRQKKAPNVPFWFGDVPGYVGEPKVDIHAVVNAHAGIKPTMTAHNTLAVLRSARSRGEMMTVLRSMAMSGRVERRRVPFCSKWLARIEGKNGR